MNVFDRNLLNLTTTTLLSTLAAATALAEPASQGGAPGFKAYDGDGRVSRETDANHNGRLSREEFGEGPAAQGRS